MPLVSILICTYNASDSILATIGSCLAQTYHHIEILIHDDQSSDDTREKIGSLTDPRIRIIHSGKKLGPYGGLNVLLDHAQGDYIAIQDHDDLWHPDKLARQLEFLEKNPDCVGCGTKTLMRYEGDQKGFEYFLGTRNYYTIHPSLVFRANKAFRYATDDVYMQDAMFQKKVLCKGEKRIGNVNETLTLHLIKAGAKNFSYKRFQYRWSTIKTIFSLHPVRYGVCILGFETIRKIAYPLLQSIKKPEIIDTIERLPFTILGKTIETYDMAKKKKMGF
ncbi:MAG: glycosyltransferase [Candidatus Absconditabacterales bacterium]|nr:glycosyltransferase [Candidatus Absconditabacterales bacterium]